MKTRFTFALAVAAIVCAGQSRAAIKTVSDFGSLQSALEGATSGDTIVMANGTYNATSAINVTASGVTLVSENGKANAILDGGSGCRLLSVSGTDFKVEGVTFRNGHYAGNGGAIYYNSSSVSKTTEIRNCDFVDCTAKRGGAIYAGKNSYSSFVGRENYGVVSGCTFLHCGIDTTGTADNWGGGGAIFGALWVEDSVFDACYCTDSNSLQYHAAIDVTSYTTITNCIFRNHSQIKFGLVGTEETQQGIGCARLIDCLIASNTAHSVDAVLFHRKVILDRCVISNNASAVTSSLTGLYRSADKSFSKVTSCLFVDNKFAFDIASMPPLYNCTFVRNVGGLAYNYNEGTATCPAITNCVFWGNFANTKWPFNAVFKGVPGLYWHGGVDLPSLIKMGNTVIEGGSSNSDIQLLFESDASGNSAALTAAIDADGPRFTNAANGNWTLKSKSLLVNAGVLCDWMAGARDLSGFPRVSGELPDIGCFEFFRAPGFRVTIK